MASNPSIDKEAYRKILPLVKKETARGAKLLTALIEKGEMTTKELEESGYGHPPRVRMDLQDIGIEIGTHYRNPHPQSGNRMGTYYLMSPKPGEITKKRSPPPKSFKKKLVKNHNHVCAITQYVFPENELQMDHRVPFLVGGDPDSYELDDWMPLSGSAQMLKKKACDDCENSSAKDVKICGTCYWAFPERYNHVATIPQSVATMVFRGDVEVELFQKISDIARKNELTVNEVIKSILNQWINQ